MTAKKTFSEQIYLLKRSFDFVFIVLRNQNITRQERNLTRKATEFIVKMIARKKQQKWIGYTIGSPLPEQNILHCSYPTRMEHFIC